MLTVRGPEARLHVWLDDKHNVRADFKRLLGEHVRHIDVAALMTDTGNNNRGGTAYYGDIWFSKD